MYFNTWSILMQKYIDTTVGPKYFLLFNLSRNLYKKTW